MKHEDFVASPKISAWWDSVTSDPLWPLVREQAIRQQRFTVHSDQGLPHIEQKAAGYRDGFADCLDVLTNRVSVPPPTKQQEADDAALMEAEQHPELADHASFRFNPE